MKSFIKKLFFFKYNDVNLEISFPVKNIIDLLLIFLNKLTFLLLENITKVSLFFIKNSFM